MTSMTKQDDYFGLCPHCMSYTGHVNAGKTTIFYCKEHMVSWVFGAGFFGGDEAEEEQRKIYDEAGIATMQRIEPAHWPKGHYADPPGVAGASPRPHDPAHLSHESRSR
jgi:hypothetical protein